MRYRCRPPLLRLVFALVILGCATIASAPALADCDAMGHGVNDSVHGYTWIGTFVKRTGMEGDPSAVDRWNVERVIAGDVPADLSYHVYAPQNGCHPVEFKRGVRYLVSTSDLEFPSNKNTVAYRLLEHGRVRLVPFLTRAEFYDDRYRVTTLDGGLEVGGAWRAAADRYHRAGNRTRAPRQRNRRQAGPPVASL
ncbi:MAG: hypothetical protein U0667_18105 [Chloroflexota bacterium]